MATVAPAHTISTITPPSSSDGNRGMWEYAVPLDHDENSNTNGVKQPSFGRDASNSTYSRQPFTSSSNGALNQSRSGDVEHLAPARIQTLRSKSSDISNASDPDSVVDLYKSPSNSALRTSGYGPGAKSGRKASGQKGLPIGKHTEEDENNWIHRDKLAQIESKELEEAGLRIGRRPSERVDGSIREKRQRLASPARIEGEVDDSAMFESSTNGDDAESTSKSSLPKGNAQRPGGSRIPVPRSFSGSMTQSERDSTAPGTRSRTGSNGWVGNASDHSPNSRPSSNESAQDDQQFTASPPESPARRTTSATSATAVERSPQKRSKNPSKTTPTGRKTTTTTTTTATAPAAATAAARQNSAAKSRNATPASKTPPELKRPGTSNGLATGARPGTSHRPEGDPPWIATMYKPDPRLPPDQQMLPTHAKRLAQEQWEKEGKTGTVYDRDFRLLNTEAFPANPNPGTFTDESTKEDSRHSTAESEKMGPTTLQTIGLVATPPLGSPRSVLSSNGRPGTSGTEHGGYRTMPNIAKPQSPMIQSPTLPVQTMRLPEPLEEENEKKKKKEGCCAGCVVM